MALAARQGRGGFCPGRRRRRVSGRSAAESLTGSDRLCRAA
jgi:hypothetical protein